MGSRTFFSTISTQLMLQSFNLLGIGLILLWALSPLGGQSSLNVINITYKFTFSNSSVKYFNSKAISVFTQTPRISRVELPLNALYSSSLLAPPTVTNSNMDFYGNVKIPVLSRLSAEADNEVGKRSPQQMMLCIAR
jgi:hypothetical protein